MTLTRHAVDLVEAAVPDALALVTAVRDDPDDVRKILHAHTSGDYQKLYALTIALAAMVPDDRTASELLAWTGGLPRKPRNEMSQQECREAHAAWVRGDRDDIDGEREYQKRRKAASKSSAA